MSQQYLTKLYELSEYGLKQEVDAYLVQSEIGLSHEKARPVITYLTDKGLISWECAVPNVRITTKGIDKMEAAKQESYVEKERFVLRKLYEERHTRHTKEFTPEQLAEELGFDLEEVTEIINELDSSGWLGGTDEGVNINAAGIKEYERTPEPPGGQHIHIHQPQNSPMVFGDHSSQSVVYNNEPISRIIPQLAGLIEAMRDEDFTDKDDVLRDLEIAHQVALANPNATAKDGAWTRILTKLNAAKATMEISGLVINSYPYWTRVIDFFSRHIQ